MAGGVPVLTNSTVGTRGFGINVSLLKSSTITQTIIGGIISAMVVASVVVTVVMVSVSAGLSSPNAKDDYVQVYKRYPISIFPLLNDNDPKTLNLTLVNVTQPTHGTVVMKDGKKVIYTSKGSFAGNDTFQYSVTNGFMISTANVHVEVLNRPPELVDISLTVSKNSIKNSIDIFSYTTENGAVISDPDNDILSVVGTTPSQVTDAIVTFDSNYVYYTPKYGFNSQDQFNYTVTDGNAFSTAVITINVENDPPVANPDTYIVPKNAKTILKVLENDMDINNDNITIVSSISGIGSIGTVITSDDGLYISYIPPPKVETLSDAFEYTITDGPTTSSSYVFLKVINTPPNGEDRSFDVPKNSKDNQLDITYTDADMLDTVTVTLLTKPTRGSFQFMEQSTITQVNYPTQDFYTVPKNYYTMVYTPEEGVIYNESFKVLISDSIETVTAIITIKVVPVAPVPSNDTVLCDKNTPITVDVVNNDYSSSNDYLMLDFVEMTTELGGMIKKIDDKNVTYTPPKDFTGIDVAPYIVKNTNKDGATEGIFHVTGYLIVSVKNNEPVAVDDVVRVSKGLIGNFELISNDYDPNGDTIEYDFATVSTQGINVGMTPSSSIVTYAALNQTYVDTFTYSIVDFEGAVSNFATVTVNVVNDAPIANDDSVTVSWNRSVVIEVLNNDVDINPGDYDALIIKSFTQPTDGLVSSFEGGKKILFKPNNGFTGDTTFNYTITDGLDESNQGTVKISVVNSAPTPGEDTASVHWNDATVIIAVLANDVDADSDPLHIATYSQPSKGIVSRTKLADGTDALIFASNSTEKYSGSISFTYTVSDYGKDSVGNVVVTLTNNAPLPVSDSYSFHWASLNNDLNVLLNDRDPNSDAIYIDSVSKPTDFEGQISIDTQRKKIVFSPNARSVGSQQFTYVATDDVIKSASSTVTLVVTNNNVPENKVINKNIHWSTQTTGTVIDIWSTPQPLDADGDSLSILSTLSISPSMGAAVVNNGDASTNPNVKYTQQNDYLGPDSFNVTITDGSSNAQVQININVYDRAPTANDISEVKHFDVVSAGYTRDVVVMCGATDEDNEDIVTIKSVTVNIGGSATFSGNLVTFVGQTGYTGPSIVTIIFTDGLLTKTVYWTITILNNDPIVTVFPTEIHWTQRSTLIDVLSAVSDADNDDITFTLTSGATTHGTPTIYSNKVNWTLPQSPLLGDSSFTVKITDGWASKTAIFVVLVKNTVPTTTNKTIEAHWSVWSSGVTVDVLSGCSDENSDPISLESVSSATSGSTEISNGKAVYKPTKGFVGRDSFTYTITDGMSKSTSTVFFTIKDNAPVASNDTISVHWRNTHVDIDVLANDVDADSDALSVDSCTQPTKGVTSINGKLIRYTLDTSPTKGVNQFTYLATDGALNSSTATVFVTITNNNTPNIAAQAQNVHWRTTASGVTYSVYNTPTDGDGDPLTLTVTGTGCSTLLSGNVKVIRFASSDFIGTATCIATLSDSLDISSKTMTTTSYNTPPKAADISVQYYGANVQNGITIEAISLATDADTDDVSNLIVSAVNPSTRYGAGAVSIDATKKKMKYFPNPSLVTETGIDTFTYIVYDGLTPSALATVTIDIRSVIPTAEEKYFDVHWRKSLGVDQDFFAFENINSYGVLELNKILTVLPNKGGLVTVNNDLMNFNYKPVVGFTGEETFVLGYNNGAGTSSITFYMNVYDNAPTAQPTFTSVHWKQIATINLALLIGDIDSDDTSYLTTFGGSVPIGTLSTNGSNVATYTPTSTIGITQPTYIVTDGLKNNTATLTIDVTNAPPTVSAKTFEITWRNYQNFDLNVLTLSPQDSDPNTDSISIKSVFDELAVGHVTKKDSSSVTISAPNSKFVGTTSFRYVVTDGASNGDVVNTVTLRVVNTAPVANNDYLSVHWNTGSIVIDVLANDVDAESDTLTITSIYGSLATQAPIISGNKITYYPNRAPLGNDTLTYVVSDGVTTSTGRVFILVTNTKPTTTSYTRNVVWKVARTGVVFNVIADSNDENSDALSISSFSSIPSTQGSVVKSSGDQSLLYIPTNGFVGKVDTINFIISDGRETVSASISIIVTNSVPTADTTSFPYHWRAVFDSSQTINLNPRFYDGDSDSVNITSITKNGNRGNVILGSSNVVTYKLTSPWKGIDTFTVSFTDGWTASSATFSIVISNDAPSAFNIPIIVHFSNYSVSIPIIGRTDSYKPIDTDSDDSNNLYINTFSAPSAGTLTLSGDRRTFTFVNPTGNLVQQTFTYSVSDGLDSSATQTVTITLQNISPTSKDQNFDVHWREAQSGFNINLLADANDNDGDVISVSYYAQPTVGTLSSLGSGVVKYVPPANQVVSTSFQFKVTDGAQTVTQTVSISLTNTAPVAFSDSYTTHWRNKSLVLNVLSNDFDANSDTIYISSIDSISTTRSATLALSDDKKSITYRDNSVLGAGVDTFKYAISDSVTTSSFVIVTITYTNSAPNAQSTSTSVLWRNVASFTNMLSKCIDSNNDPLSFTGITQGRLGSITLTDSTLGSFIYTPSNSITYTNTPSDGSTYSVTDSFTYSCSDGPLSASGSVLVTITNTPPKGSSKTTNVTRNYSNPTATFNNLLVGVSDDDGDTVSISSVVLLPNQNSGTSVVLNADGSVKFTYSNSFIGTQQFYVYLTDGQLTSSYVYTVNIVGSALNCIDYYVVSSKNDVSIQFEDNLRLALVKVSGSEPATISIVSTTNLKVGTITKTSNKWTYNPTNTRSCVGDNCFATYSYSNTAGQTVTCKIIVNQPNNAPIAPRYNHVYSVSRASNVAQIIDYLAVSNAYDADTADKLTLTSIINIGTCTSEVLSSLSVASNKISFLRKTNFVGSSCWFIVGVVDSDLDNPIVVPANVTITPTASPPIAVNDIVSTKYNSQVDISVSTLLSNDYDSLGGTFKFSSISCPNGYCSSGFPIILNPNDPSNSQVIRVKPVANSCDSIQFVYSIVSDQDGTSSSATVTIQYTSCTCSLDMDIIFVLDGSGSISADNWINMKNFMGNVTKGFGSNIKPTGTNIGIIQFASSIVTHLQVNNGNTVDEVLSKISSANQLKSGTGSIAGINAAIDQMVSLGRKNIINKMIIHVTDGESTEPCSCSTCATSFSSNTARYGAVPTYCKSPRFPGMNCSMCNWSDSKSRCNPCSEATLRSTDLNSWYPGYSMNAEVSKYGTGIWSWRQLAIGIGSGLTSALGKVQIQRMNYDTNNPLYVDWSNLSNVYQLVVDNSCNTVTSSQTKTLVPLANSGMTITYKGKTTRVTRSILSTNWVRSTFNYTVSVATGAPSGVKKFTLAMASGYEQDAFIDYLPYFPVYLGVEPITGWDSFSFDSAPGVYTIAKGKSYTYSLTVEGDITEDTIDFGIFGDSQYAVGKIKGPSSVIAPYSPQPPNYIENTSSRKSACSATLGRCYIYTKFSTGYSKAVMAGICKFWRDDAKLVMIQSAAEKSFIQTILPTTESISFPIGMTYVSGVGTWEDGSSTATYSDFSSTSNSGPVVYANYVHTAPSNRWWITASISNTNVGVVCWAPFA